MAAITAAISAVTTTNNAALTTGAFTPVANDLLVVFFVITGGTGFPTVTDTQSLGWDAGPSATKAASADKLWMFISRNFAAASSMTVTATPSGGPTSTGVAISVLRVSGMIRKGVDALRSSGAGRNIATVDNAAGGTTPNISLFLLPNQNNPVVGSVANAANPATMTNPTGWTEAHDVGYATPTTGLETAFKNSAHNNTSVQWGSSSASDYCAVAAELETSPLDELRQDLNESKPIRRKKVSVSVCLPDVFRSRRQLGVPVKRRLTTHPGYFISS